MNDINFLIWMHNRLVHQHGEHERYNYMYRLRAIIARLSADQNTSDSMEYPDLKSLTNYLDKKATEND